tara:strand:+ start:12863 stop:14131 length:1269 start_codon:yes stop_codon:yes gene_type:complete
MASTHPEALFIAALLRSGDQTTLATTGIGASHFASFHNEFKWIDDYVQRHRRLPSKAAFRAHYPEFPFKVVDDVDHFAHEIEGEYRRRLLLESIDTAVQFVKAEDVDGAVAALQSNMVTMSSSFSGADSEDEVHQWQSTYNDVIDRCRRYNENGLAGIQFGFPSLNDFTGGAQPGDYWVIAARLGQGKTWTLIKMAVAAMLQGKTVQFNTLEQTRQQITLRSHSFLSKEMGFPPFKSFDLMQGKITDLSSYRDFLEKLGGKAPGKLIVSDTSRGRMSAGTLAAQIERNHPDIIFIDYLTLLEKEGADWQAVAQLSSEIKVLSQKYGIPFIVAAQINRMGIGRDAPGTESLSFSDNIGQDADGVVTLKQMTKHIVQMRLAKYRHGRDGQRWYAKFNPDGGVYEEVSANDADNIMAADEAEVTA